jgi:hypothetical protein
MSMVAFCAATVVANTLAAQTAASAAAEMEDKQNIVNAPMILVHKRSGARCREPIQRLFGRKPSLKQSLDNNGAQPRFFAPQHLPRRHFGNLLPCVLRLFEAKALNRCAAAR